MKVSYLTIPKNKWYNKIKEDKNYPRHWITIEDMEITLSNTTIALIPKGYIFDGASIPKCLWRLFSYLDLLAIWYLIHDFLYTDKKNQLEIFNYHIYNARKFADKELLLWTVNEKWYIKFTTKIFYYIIRLLGGFYYSRQFKLLT